MNIEERIEKYLGEAKVPKKLKSYFDKFNPMEWHEDAVNVFETFEDLVETGKMKEALKYIQSIVRQGKPKWHGNAVYIARELLNL